MVLVHPSFFGGGFYDNLSENYDFILTDPSSAAGLYIGNVGSGSNSPTQEQILIIEFFMELLAVKQLLLFGQ